MAFSIKERIQLLKGTSLFQSLPLDDLAQLAELMLEKDFPANQIILTEGEPSPNFYVIAEGEIEVSKFAKGKAVPLIVLSAGDTIGIIDKRALGAPATASMKTLSSVRTLVISKAGLLENIAKHPNISEQLDKQADLIEKENFLRLLTPFKKLPLEKVRELIKKITKKKIAKNEIIIREGEEGQTCYLIVSGLVEFFIHSRGEAPIESLGAGGLFGEMAVLSEAHQTRNSTAVAKEDCVLYEISGEVFRSIVYSNRDTQEMVLFFYTNRSRPLKKENIIITEQIHADGSLGYIFKNPENNRYLQVSEAGLYFFNLLDGTRKLQEITFLLYQEKGILNPDLAAKLLMDFYEAGMLAGLVIPRKDKELPLEKKAWNLVKRVLTVQYTLKNTDAFITKFYNKVARYIFLKPSLYLISGLILFGLFFYVENATHIVHFFKGGEGRYWWLLAVLPLTILTSGAHELAHAYTCKHFKREVHGFGIGWFWVAAFAFCDTTDMWLATRRQRIIVNLAGCINDLALAGIASIAAFLVRNTTLDIILWLYATVTYLSFATNLNVIVELDGYYALMDALDIPDLRGKAAGWLGSLPGSFIWNSETKKILIYWTTCVFYIFINIVLLLIFQKWVIFQLLPHAVSEGPQAIIRWILPYLIIFQATFTVLNEVIKKRKK